MRRTLDLLSEKLSVSGCETTVSYFTSLNRAFLHFYDTDLAFLPVRVLGLNSTLESDMCVLRPAAAFCLR